MPVPVVDPITILDNPYGMELILKSQLLRLKLQKDSKKRGEHWKHPNPTVKSDLPSTEIIAQLIGFILATQNLYFLTTASSKNHHPTKADRFFCYQKTYFLKKNTTTSVTSSSLVPQTYRHQGDVKPAWYSESTWATMSQEFSTRVFHSLPMNDKDRLAKMDSFPRPIREWKVQTSIIMWNHHRGIGSLPKKNGVVTRVKFT